MANKNVQLEFQVAGNKLKGLSVQICKTLEKDYNQIMVTYFKHSEADEAEIFQRILKIMQEKLGEFSTLADYVHDLANKTDFYLDELDDLVKELNKTLAVIKSLLEDKEVYTSGKTMSSAWNDIRRHRFYAPFINSFLSRRIQKTMEDLTVKIKLSQVREM